MVAIGTSLTFQTDARSDTPQPYLKHCDGAVSVCALFLSMAKRMRKPQGTKYCLAAAAAVACALTGCGGGDGRSKYEDFETLQLRESLVEASLGSYIVPVPVVQADDTGHLVRTNLLQMKFSLHGLIKPEHQSETERLVERHEGELRDRVIRVCRNSSLEDLLDPQLSTFRSRVLDEAQPLLEGVSLRRVLVTNVITEPL